MASWASAQALWRTGAHTQPDQRCTSLVSAQPHSAQPSPRWALAAGTLPEQAEQHAGMPHPLPLFCITSLLFLLLSSLFIALRSLNTLSLLALIHPCRIATNSLHRITASTHGPS